RMRRPTTPALFPYTTLFRSCSVGGPVRTVPVMPKDPMSITPSKKVARYTVVASALSNVVELICHWSMRRLLVPTYSKPRWVEVRSEEHTSELQSRENLVCRL